MRNQLAGCVMGGDCSKHLLALIRMKRSRPVASPFRFPELPGLPQVSIMRGIHFAAEQVLKRSGYRWELRRNGELKLGLWRKTFKKSSERTGKNPHPKRFVLVPGLGDTVLSWWGVLGALNPILRKQYDEIILVDFPGFRGFLSREKSFHSMDLLVKALSDVFDSTCPHTILGHSLGGWLTSLYAISCGKGERPVEIGKRSGYPGPELIILVNPSGAFPSAEIRAQIDAIFIRAVKEGFQAIRPFLFGKEPRWFKLLAHEFSDFMVKEDTVQFLESIRDDHCVEDFLERVRSKVWLVWGEHDTLIPLACLEKWMERLERSPAGPAQAVVLKNAGHSLQVEKPVITAAVIGQILLGKPPHGIGSRWWNVIHREAESQATST